MSEQKEELTLVFTWGQRQDQTCWASLECGLYHNQGDVHLHPVSLKLIEKAFTDSQANARLTKRVAELEAWCAETRRIFGHMMVQQRKDQIDALLSTSNTEATE